MIKKPVLFQKRFCSGPYIHLAFASCICLACRQSCLVLESWALRLILRVAALQQAISAKLNGTDGRIRDMKISAVWHASLKRLYHFGEDVVIKHGA